jgi:hypothetical protein
MIYATSREGVEQARVGFLRKWKLCCKAVSESVGNFVFVSHTMKPVGAGGRYGGEQGRRDRG